MKKSKLETIKATALAAATQRAEVAREKAAIAFYSNNALVDLELRKIHRTDNIAKLQTMIEQINALPSVRLPEIGEVRVQAIQTTKSYFKSEISMLLAIIGVAKSAFIDEHREAILAIIGTDIATIEDLSDAIGQPAYWSKRNLMSIEATNGNYAEAKELLQLFATSIGLNELDINKFKQSEYNRWFEQSKLTVERKRLELERTQALDKEYGAFTLDS